eukprot:CAMPEP_0169482956 /NCGR_PEP_ID=MMETSP1042-20121227/30961_1 /TAXON_ID=464988 /ORGANISM="Hemiselmis andersenii, Strain CCMP1180" /LENGTH=38 /DNA_ID= /DNA_START= /DNA_END= /DNA_ORIENTATION=
MTAPLPPPVSAEPKWSPQWSPAVRRLDKLVVFLSFTTL